MGFRFESTNGWNEVARARRELRCSMPTGSSRPIHVVGNSAFTVNRAKFLPEPRVGLAWDPFGKSRTVIHAGFGMYRALLDNLDYRLDQTAPFNTTESLKNVPLAGLHDRSGTPLPAGTQDFAQRHLKPDLYTPTVITWTFKIEQQLAPQHVSGCGLCGFARLSRNAVGGCQRADSDHLSGRAVPCEPGRRHGLLSVRRAAGESESGEYDHVVFRRAELVQCAADRCEPPVRAAACRCAESTHGRRAWTMAPR